MLTKFLNFSTAFTCLLLYAKNIDAQSVRPYSIVYSQNIKGGTVIFGNTSMHSLNALGIVDSLQMNDSGNPSNTTGGIGYSQYGNDNENMQPAKIDVTTPLLINATSADLILPAGSNTIKFARLYWGGRVNNTITLAAPDTLRKVKIRKGNSGAYSNITAAASSTDFSIITANESVYQTYIDITSYIQSNGAGTYTVADVPSNAGAISSGGNYAGWCIMIAYENLSQPLQSVRIYDGFIPVYNAGNSVSQIVTLTGLNVPSNPLLLGDAIMSTMVWEGDANLGASTASPAGDYIKVNNIAVSNFTNPITNFWNSSISKNGAFVTSKNPDYTNQKGIDIDELQVGTGYGILPNANTITIEFGTEADRYFPSIFGFAIRMKDPALILNKTVTDANNNNILESEEVITYTLSGSNIGAGTAFNTVVVDSLPSNVNYVLGSLKIINAPNVATPTNQTDGIGDDFAFKSTHVARDYVKFYLGTNATFTSGGEISENQTYQLSFKVKAEVIPGSVINIARITATSQTGELFTDDGTAIIGPTGGPVAVTLLSFYGKIDKDENLILWATEHEINNDYFIIESSTDGAKFSKIGIVKGEGNSASIINYAFKDPSFNNAATIFYRLKMVNKSGEYSYTKIISINRTSKEDALIAYPNPFFNQLKIRVEAVAETDATCRIISFEGKEVLVRKIKLEKGINEIVLKDVQHILKGQYVLEIVVDGKKVITKILKN